MGKSEELSSIGLLHFAKSCLDMDTVYVFGCIGEVLTPGLILRKRASYPDHFTIPRMLGLMSRCNCRCLAFDCSGLLKRYVMGGLDNYHYAPEFDLNCAALFEASPVKGEMAQMPQTPGICLYMAGHTGIYAGNGKIIESTPNEQFGDGVVETRLSDRPWTHWYRFPWITYD